MTHWQYKCTQTQTNTTFRGLMRREVRMLLWVVDGKHFEEVQLHAREGRGAAESAAPR